MDCVAFIPAKAHSRRLPGKNTRLCAGTSLVQRAVDCAREAGIFKEVWVSTESVPLWMGLKRPPRVWLHERDPKLSEDGVTVAAVVASWLGYLTVGDAEQDPELFPMPDAFCVLWPTSPLRTPEILRAMWERFQASGESTLHSAHEVDFGRTYAHEGTAIFMRTLAFLQRLSLDLRVGDPVYPIPAECVCDVNTAADLAEAERRLLARTGA